MLSFKTIIIVFAYGSRLSTCSEPDIRFGEYMQTITNPEELTNVADNSFIGTLPSMNNCRIEFSGTGNVLFCEDGVMLSGGTIRFSGNNSLVILRKSRYYYKLDLTVYSNSVFFSGVDNYYNGALHAICSEGKYIILGDDCLFSFGIWIRTADPHLIYDAKTKKRINFSKDVLVGDHVWVGQDAMLLKGTMAGSGSIIGAKAVTSGCLFSNSSWGGVPARCIGEDLFWDRPSVHNYTEKDTKASATFTGKPFIYSPDGKTVDCSTLFASLHHAANAEERLSLIQEQLFTQNVNRFFIGSSQSSKQEGLYARMKSRLKRS